MAGRIQRIDATTGKHIGAGHKTGRHGAPRHQHFDAMRCVAQQQNSGRRAGRGWRARGMQELGGSDHAVILHGIAAAAAEYGAGGITSDIDTLLAWDVRPGTDMARL